MPDDSPITEFRGPYAFLSNFYPVLVSLADQPTVTYPTVEHAFQAAKTLNPSERNPIWLAGTPGYAKKLGRSVALRPDWEHVKRFIMAELLEQKFNWAPLANRLLATNPCPLIEVNTWNDTYWGCIRTPNGLHGQNVLGQLLMERRTKLAHTGMRLDEQGAFRA